MPDVCLFDWRRETLPAPHFRKAFSLPTPGPARLRVSGLGYFEAYLNGVRVGDHVLDPVVTHYDRRVRFVEHDVSSLLREGRNAVGVILGNGWYNCQTAEVWHFDKAPWRDYPKLLLELDVAGERILASDASWKVATGPILFDALRNGEIYDARLEREGWTSPDFDDGAWRRAAMASPPGGILEPQTMPPCKVTERLHPVRTWTTPEGSRVFDFGQNIAGWVCITVSGPAGAQVVIRYGERLDSSGRLDSQAIRVCVLSGDFQTDRYTLKGSGHEVWHPRFTYHGFQYAEISSDADLLAVEAWVVHTAFQRVGWFECSSDIVNRLEACALRSYVSNFVGIPTDCPHREKHGWTGDAHIASETGLCHFRAGGAYGQWLDNFPDVQRPSGQLPGIVPSAGWGYNWGSGPAWDSALLIIPWHVYVYEGDIEPARRLYEAMRRYVDYLTSMADDHIVSFGLGDWCHVDAARSVSPAVTSTAFYYLDASLLARFAALTGRTGDHERYTDLAAAIAASFHRHFYQGDGVYGRGEPTALACALELGLAPEGERQRVLMRLVTAIESNEYKADFGILGARWIPRALAEYGQVETAFRLITQPRFPGWVNWLNQGATSLWETWAGDASRNHIMFGDISAWMVRYLGGLVPDPDHPGFKRFRIRPQPVRDLQWAQVLRDVPGGRIRSAWKRQGGEFVLEVEVPVGSQCTVTMPDGSIHEAPGGRHRYTCPDTGSHPPSAAAGGERPGSAKASPPGRPLPG